MLRAMAIMKTDIRGSTAHFRTLPEADLTTLLIEHRELVSRLAKAHDGRVVKGEGDGYWVVFPSITGAALAAMSMQEELRLAQPDKGDQRLAMRIVLTLGDVLEQDGGLVGDAVVLATRIESVTPPDQVYMSASAWHAANKAELRAARVDSFALKGFPEPVAVYRLEQTHRMRVIPDQYIVVADLRRFGSVAAQSSMSVVERILDHLLELMRTVCANFGGTHRSTSGDAYLLTFADVAQAMAAVEQLAEDWTAFQHREAIPCSMNVAVHKGALYLFRAFLLGDAPNLTFNVEAATSRLDTRSTTIYVTGPVRKDLAGTRWDARLLSIHLERRPPRLGDVEIHRLAPTGSVP